MDFRIIVVFTMSIFVHCSSASPVFDNPNEDEDDPSGSPERASMNQEINTIQAADLKVPEKSGAVLYTYKWISKGRKHQEKIYIDKNKQIEKIHVDADGESEEADVIIDFKYKTTISLFLGNRVCFLGPLDEKNEVPPNELAKDLEKTAEKKKPAALQQEVDTTTNWEVDGLLRNRSSLSKEMASLCRAYPIYKIKKIRAQDTASELTSPSRGKRGYYCFYKRTKRCHACGFLWLSRCCCTTVIWFCYQPKPHRLVGWV